MYGFLHDLLSDKKGGETFTLFSAWHFFYIALALLSVITILFALRQKEKQTKQKIASRLISIAFALYVIDFF